MPYRREDIQCSGNPCTPQEDTRKHFSRDWGSFSPLTFLSWSLCVYFTSQNINICFRWLLVVAVIPQNRHPSCILTRFKFCGFDIPTLLLSITIFDLLLRYVICIWLACSSWIIREKTTGVSCGQFDEIILDFV